MLQAPPPNGSASTHLATRDRSHPCGRAERLLAVERSCVLITSLIRRSCGSNAVSLVLTTHGLSTGSLKYQLTGSFGFSGTGGTKRPARFGVGVQMWQLPLSCRHGAQTARLPLPMLHSGLQCPMHHISEVARFVQPHLHWHACTGGGTAGICFSISEA